MKNTRLPGLRYWGQFQPDRGIDFNGFWVADGAGPGAHVVLDPMPLGARQHAELSDGGGVAFVLLSNADHLRGTAEVVHAFPACKVVAPFEERLRFGDQAELVDHWFGEGAPLPEALRGSFEPYPLRGGKSEVEYAFHLPVHGALFFGDAVRSHETGSLRLLPQAKLADVRALLGDLRGLSGLDFDAVLLGDGDSILFRGREAFDELLSREHSAT